MQVGVILFTVGTHSRDMSRDREPGPGHQGVQMYVNVSKVSASILDSN